MGGLGGVAGAENAPDYPLRAAVCLCPKQSTVSDLLASDVLKAKVDEPNK